VEAEVKNIEYKNLVPLNSSAFNDTIPVMVTAKLILTTSSSSVREGFLQLNSGCNQETFFSLWVSFSASFSLSAVMEIESRALHMLGSSLILGLCPAVFCLCCVFETPHSNLALSGSELETLLPLPTESLLLC
jgi:hypothetical protein